MATNVLINELLLCDPFRSRTTTHVYVAHPSPVEERTLGKLILVAEVHVKSRTNVDLLSAVQETLKTAYYQSERDSIEASFEDALAKTNERIAELVGDFGRDWFNQLDLLAAVVRGTDVLFANVGRVSALLLHRGRIVDLLGGTPTVVGGERNPVKTFSSVVNGKLETDDHLLFLTSAFFDYISQEKLKRLFIDGTSDAAIRHLERLLSENENDAAFGAVAVTVVPDVMPVTVRPLVADAGSPTAPQASMNTLIAKEAATREILEGSFWRTAGKSVRGAGRRIRVLFRSVILGKPTRISRALESDDRLARDVGRRSSLELSQDLHRRTRLLERERRENLPASIRRSAWRSLLAFVHVIRRLPQLVRRAPTVQDWKAIPDRQRSFVNRVVIWFKRLPRARRAALIVTLLAAVVLAQGLTVSSRSRGNGGSTDTAATLASIDQNVKDAQASLLYGDESTARTLVAEATESLAALGAKKVDRGERERLEGLLNDLREKLRHAIVVSDPVAVGDFASAKPNATPTGLSLTSTRLLAINPADNSLLTMTLADGTVGASASSSVGANYQYGVLAGNTYLALLTNYRVADIAPGTGRATEAALTLPPEANVTAIAFYEGRFYLLDAKNGQIWRAVRSGAGYGTATAWFATPQTELYEPGSLAIDGSIYVLSASGKLRKYTRGAVDELSVDPVDPALSNGTKIVASAASEFLYVLDAKEKRLLVFEKDGTFLRQYTSDRFTDLRDLAVNADGKTAYLMNGTTVYRVPLTDS